MGTQPSPRTTPTAPKTATFSEEAEVIIDLFPAVGADGQEVFAPQDMVLANGQLLAEPSGLAVPANDDNAVADVPTAPRLSVIPNDRMAASWAEVADALRRNERGDQRNDVVMGPGGSMEITVSGATPTTSQLPKGRMSAKPYIRLSDIDVVKQCDPHNVENWTPVFTDILDGWQFSLQPLPGGEVFTFVAFRSPNDAGWWRIWVQHPDMDERLGHKTHMITTVVAGETIPVICSNPGGAGTSTLAEARLNAGKWAMYTQRCLLGQDPVFSK